MILDGHGVHNIYKQNLKSPFSLILAYRPKTETALDEYYQETHKHAHTCVLFGYWRFPEMHAYTSTNPDKQIELSTCICLLRKIYGVELSQLCNLHQIKRLVLHPGAPCYQSSTRLPWHIPSFKITSTQSSIWRQFYAFLIWNLNKLLSSPCWLSINSDDFPCH